MPSVVFAEATWYGSLRGGLQSSSGSDLEYFDGGSRWGIKGSAEVSDGLTAVYRFEHKISTANGSQPGGRLAYAGLSGGFGTITLGQIWNAAYNHAGAITDTSYYFGNATTGYRHGSALSYAFSTGPVGFQLDLVSDGSKDTGQGIDKTEFGVTVGLGEVGKIALAHTNMRDTMKTTMTPDTYWVRKAAGAGDPDTEAHMITVYITGAQNIADNVKDGKLTTAGVELIQRTGNRYHATGALAAECKTLADNTDSDDDCTTATAFVSSVTTTAETVAAGGGVPTAATTTEDYHLEGTAAGNVVKTPAASMRELLNSGHKNTHIAVEFNVGGVTPYLGHSTKKNNHADKNGVIKTKTTHYGVRGGLGDTGINFLVAARNVKPDGGTKTSPWLFNLSKNLGGGATVIFEHANYDNDEPGNKETAIGLHVTF